MSKVVAPKQATDAVERLAEQMQGLSLAEQVELLQRLAQYIEQNIGVLFNAKGETPSAFAQEQPALSKREKEHSPIPAEVNHITYRIIGCAQAVHQRLGRGLRENSYQRALEAELINAGLACRPQQRLAVYDSPASDGSQGRLLGYYIPDFIIEDRVIVEIKALAEIDTSHMAQVIGYLAVSGCRVGLLINFAEYHLHPRRILPPSNLSSYQPNHQWLWNPSQTTKTPTAPPR